MAERFSQDILNSLAGQDPAAFIASLLAMGQGEPGAVAQVPNIGNASTDGLATLLAQYGLGDPNSGEGLNARLNSIVNGSESFSGFGPGTSISTPGSQNRAPLTASDLNFPRNSGAASATSSGPLDPLLSTGRGQRINNAPTAPTVSTGNSPSSFASASGTASDSYTGSSRQNPLSPSSLNLLPELPGGNTVTTGNTGGTGTGLPSSGTASNLGGGNAGTALNAFGSGGPSFNFGTQFTRPSGGSVGGQAGTAGTGGPGFDGLGPAFNQTQTAFNDTSAAFDAAIGTDAFQSGNWFTDLFKGDNALTREGAFGDNGWFSPVLQGVGVGLDLWSGIQGNNLARDSLDFQKQAYNQNYQQQLKAYNRAADASANTAFRG